MLENLQYLGEIIGVMAAIILGVLLLKKSNFTDTGTWYFPYGALGFVSGGVMVIGGSMGLYSLGVNESFHAQIRKATNATQTNTAVYSEPTGLTVKDGKVSWDAPANGALWMTVNVTAKTPTLFTIGLKTPERITYVVPVNKEFEHASLKNAAKVTIWYGTANGPSASSEWTPK